MKRLLVNFILEGYGVIIASVICFHIFCVILFFKACIDISAIRRKVAPSAKQMLKDSETEYKMGNISSEGE